MIAPGPLAQASPALRRLVAVGLLLAVIFVALLWGALPLWRSYSDAEASASQLEMALHKLDSARLDPAALEIELRNLKSKRAVAPGLLTGPSDALASAELQNRLKTATEAARGAFRSAQALPARDDGPYRRVGVRAQMSVKLGELVRILHELESSQPYLFIDRVGLRVSTPFYPGKSAQAEGQEPDLDVTFDLYGYVRKPAGSSA
ncbi:MAG TPA: type II secretion system protein GspM [Stellaceae bacterium]|nr:type II secretion system protein GspM [Stellaceae bacterium]